MTFEEIVEHYNSQSWTYGWKVTKRSDLTIEQLKFRATTCICGYCGDGKLCVCGEDWVVEGRSCITCKRPWWCER